MQVIRDLKPSGGGWSEIARACVKNRRTVPSERASDDTSIRHTGEQACAPNDGAGRAGQGKAS